MDLVIALAIHFYCLEQPTPDYCKYTLVNCFNDKVVTSKLVSKQYQVDVLNSCTAIYEKHQ